MFKPSSWRDVLPIHPAAELFPLMTPDELRLLGEDIRTTGLTSPIALWQPDPKSPAQLLDGRNRLDAIEAEIGRPAIVGAPSLMTGEGFLACNKVIVLDKSVDPYAYVISVNIHRRHLTAEQRRELIAALLKADPSKSDRQIAETVKASPTFVGKVRAEKEATGDVSTVDTRRDSKGRNQRAHRSTSAPSKTKPDTTKATTAAPPPSEDTRDDIGPESSGEIARLQARVEELQAEKRRLEIENVGLHSEIEDAKAARAPSGLAEELDPLLETLFEQACLKNMVTVSLPTIAVAVCKLERLLVERGVIPKSRRSEDPQGYVRLLKQRAAPRRDKESPPPASPESAPPPADDGLDIPANLRRTNQGAS
jgi:hypothetical protein